MHYSITELISYFGGLLGIILFVVTLTTSKRTKTIKYSLAAVLLVWSIMIIFGALTYSGKAIYFIHIIRFDSPIHYLLGPSVYFFTYSITRPKFKFRKIHLLHLLPFTINLIEFTPFYLSSSDFKLSYYAKLMEHGTVVIPMQYFLKTISFTSYFIAQLYVCKRLRFKKREENKIDPYLVSWLLIYFGSQLVLALGVLTDHLTGLHLFNDPYRFAINMVTFCLYMIVIALLFFPSLLYGSIPKENSFKEKYSNSKLSGIEKDTILNHLYDFMKRDEKPFINPKISLLEIASYLKTSPQQVSQVINEKTHLNFNDFVNTYRIEEAKKILLSASFSKLTIDAIAQKSGFNSKSAFYTAFKKDTNMTPKEFVMSTTAIPEADKLEKTFKTLRFP